MAENINKTRRVTCSGDGSSGPGSSKCGCHHNLLLLHWIVRLNSRAVGLTVDMTCSTGDASPRFSVSLGGRGMQRGRWGKVREVRGEFVRKDISK